MLEKMIDKWLSVNIIDEKTAEILLNDIKEEKTRRNKIKINILIYTVAAIFLGTGVISFIAANDWLIDLLNRVPVIKISALAILTICSLFFGYKMAYENSKFPKLGHALIFLSSLLIGGTYALIGQSYNINANNSSLMFLWLLSIIPVAYAFKNYAVNIVSIIVFILGIIFYYMNLGMDEGEIWTVYIPILTGCALYCIGNISPIVKKYHKFSLSYKLTGLAFIFTILLILTCSVEDTYKQTSFFYIIPPVILIIGNLINYITSKNHSNLLKIETSFMTFLLLCLLIMLVLPEVSIPCVMILANIAIIAAISTGYNYGYKFENHNTVGLINWFLIIYLLTNYCRWGWNYMEKAAFFTIGGIILLALGMFLENCRKKIVRKDA